MNSYVPVACTLLFALAAGDVHAQSKEAIDATHRQPDAPATVYTTDLDFDAGFGTAGFEIFDFNVANANHDEAMRVFPRCESVGGICNLYYFLVGFHGHGDGTWDAAVAKLDDSGQPVAGFGTNGRITVPTMMSTMRDVAFNPLARRLYFVGAQRIFLFPDLQFSIFCLDLVTGAGCAGFGNPGNTPGYQYVVFNLGGNNNDVATRIVFDPAGFLFVTGYAAATNGYEIAAAKLDATSGALVTAFGNAGQQHYALAGSSSGQDVNVFDMALAPSTATQGKQLYLVGNANVSAGIYQGYLLGLDPATGVVTTNIGINNPDRSHGAAATAITVLANGNLAIAGTADTSVADRPSLLIARVKPAAMAFDLAFCGGGVCIKALATGLLGWRNTRPSAIGERPGNRDLMIGMWADTWNIGLIGNPTINRKQVVQQYGANGQTLHASQEIDFAAVNGGLGTSSSAGMVVDNGYVEIVGSRVWSLSTDDLDVTITRLRANDSIFASQFGTPTGD